MAMGTLAMKQAAISDPQKYTSPRTRKVGTPTLTVYWETVVMKVSAYTNSWVTRVKLKMMTVRMPATEIGITTLAKAPSRLSPSIMAASSMSGGMALKKPMRSQVQKGTVKDG